MKFLKGLMKNDYYTKTSEHKSMEKIKCPVCGKDINGCRFTPYGICNSQNY